MMIEIVWLTISCMKDQGTYTKSKAKYNKKGTLHNTIPQEEETSTLTVDSEEEDEDEAWAEVEARSSVTNAHNQAIWQGTVKTLVPLAVTVTHLSMSLNIIL
jgi:hypothetical protein